MFKINDAINNITNETKEIDLSFIKHLPELDIYKHYLGHNVKVGGVVKSPFRQDNNPSFGLYYTKSTNKLQFKDFATNECGGVIDFVMKIENCSFKEALDKIRMDILKNYDVFKSGKTRRLNPTYEYVKTISNKIGIVRQEFTSTDIVYWKKYFINLSTLKKFKVFSIKHYLLNDIVKWSYNNNSIMFAYKINNHFKIYRPFEKGINKWRTNCDKNDIQGLEQLPAKGNLLVVTKSLKDVMVLYELGIPAIAPHSETAKLSLELIKSLKKRFNNIILFYDNDEAGINNSTALYNSIKHFGNIFNFHIHKRFGVKDVSDFIEKYGVYKTKKYISYVIKKYNI